MKMIERIRNYYRRAPYTSIWRESIPVKLWALAVLIAVIYLVARFL